MENKTIFLKGICLGVFIMGSLVILILVLIPSNTTKNYYEGLSVGFERCENQSQLGWWKGNWFKSKPIQNSSGNYTLYFDEKGNTRLVGDANDSGGEHES